MPNRPNFPVPDDIYADTICIQLEIPNTSQWKQVITGCFMEMGYWFNWQRTGDDRGSQAAKRWRALIDEIDWSGMSCCCPEPAPLKFKYVGLKLYTSTDGGVTYQESPTYDYRVNSALWQKPSELGIISTRCQAADSVIVEIRDKIVQQVTDDMGAAAILGLIAAVLLIFLSEGTTGAITAQVQAIVAAILTAGVSAWQAAFTTDVWDKFRCLIYENMADDESISQAGLDAVYSGLDSTFTGIVVPTLKGYIAAAGLVGINNMMASLSGDPDADCTACEDPCDSISNFNSGLWYEGSYFARNEYIHATGDNWIEINSADRGDGQQVIYFCAIDGVSGCCVRWEMISDPPPDSVIKFYNLTPAHAEYNTLVRNDLMGECNNVTMYAFQMSAGSWRMRFTLDDCCS